MITRDQALQLIEEHVENKNIIKHMFALEAVMGALWDKFKTDGIKEEWMMAGLLHDGDYCEEIPPEKQGIQVVEWAKEKDYGIPENVSHAIAAHNWSHTEVEPVNKIDWSIFCADSLTGLVVAVTLVRPEKKLEKVTVEMILKKFGQQSFAGGTRREDIKLCEEKLGIKLNDFIQIALTAMQGISKELGL